MALSVVAEQDEGPDEPRLKLVAAAQDSDPERHQPERYVETPPPPTKKPERPIRSRDEIEQLMDVMGAIAKALSLRLLLFVAFAAMFALGWMAMDKPDPLKLVAMGVFAVLAFLPVCALVYRKG